MSADEEGCGHCKKYVCGALRGVELEADEQLGSSLRGSSNRAQVKGQHQACQGMSTSSVIRDPS